MDKVTRKMKSFALFVGLFSLGFALLSFVFVHSIVVQQKRETKRYLLEVATQCKSTLEQKVTGDLETIIALAAVIGENIENQQMIEEMIQTVSGEHFFMRIGFIDQTGTGYVVDEDGAVWEDKNFSDRDFFLEAMKGNTYVSPPKSDRLIQKGKVSSYSVPVVVKGEIVGVVAAAEPSSQFLSILNTPVFGNKGYFQIVDNQGGSIMGSTHITPTGLDSSQGISDLPGRAPYAALEDMRTGGEGAFSYQEDGQTYWATYVELGFNDWHLVCVVPDKAISQHMVGIVVLSVAGILIVGLLFVALFFYMMHMLKHSQREIIRMAYYDDLTGLYNRAKFIRCAREQLKNTSDNYALAVLDINHFKFINELFGFERGNFILQNIAQVLREESASHELYARESADHFCLLYRYRTKEQLQARLNGIMQKLAAFSTYDQAQCSIIVSCGVNLIKSGEGEDVALMLDHAFLALKQAKGKHVNTLHFYDKQLHQRESYFNELESRMYEALAAGEFVVYLQPQYSLQTGHITGAEALVRWQPPSEPIIPPDTFIPLFERNGFIVELDRYVLQQVCVLLKRWKSQGYQPVPVSVNQSRTHLYQWGNYLADMKKLLLEQQVDSSLLMLEITESVAMENPEEMKELIYEFHKMGIKVSMDDFGSGYSSLNALKELPFDELKLDRNFFLPSQNPERDEVIVRKMIELAQALQIKTVAEGVEKTAQESFLKEAGCLCVQGYLYAKPMPVADFEVLAFGIHS